MGFFSGERCGSCASYINNINRKLTQDFFKISVFNSKFILGIVYVLYKGSLCITSFSNVSDDKGFKIGDHLEISVNFIANPKANVSWTFIPWNDHRPRVVKVEQNQENSTTLWIQSLDMKEYGIYQLELVNRFGKETKAFYVQGIFLIMKKCLF